MLRGFDPEAPLSVGNGEFAFTADVTGLQTFAEAYEQTIPLGTFSQWGWHTAPNPNGWSIDRFRFGELESHGRRVGYADIPGDRRTPEIEWLRGNPHRLHLGWIGFRQLRGDGREAEPADLTDVEQALDLWNGVLGSRFRLDGQPVRVETLCHPERDLLAVRVDSPLLRSGRIAVRLAFPYGTGAASGADWSRPAAHTTELRRPGPRSARFERSLDADAYAVEATWTGGASLDSVAPHYYRLSGGAIDLSGSADARWRELERRIVLSQYLTAIQCAGRYPPQESGLTFNSWEGKFHLEMHLWHAAHFALWDRLPLLERSLGYYAAILARAKATARRLGRSARPARARLPRRRKLERPRRRPEARAVSGASAKR